MCTNKKQVYIESLHRSMYVDCGHCPACLQAKAMKRSNRIRWQAPDARLVPWFVTLTYDNKYIPYIRPSEYRSFCDGKLDTLNVYRDNERAWRQVTNKGSRSYALKDIPTIKPLLKLKKEDFEYYGYQFDFSIYKNYNFPLLRRWLDSKHFEYITDKCGVALYSEASNFIKRLKNYLRKDGNDKVQDLKYFVCTEYGSSGQRPHIHLVIWTSKMSREDFASTVCKAWPYADITRTKQYIDRAYDPASYVSSYVNCRSDAQTFFRYSKPFMPKHKISQDFGFALDVFSPLEIFQKFLRRDLHFDVQRVKKGQLTTESVILPKYVINRYFPRFKGFSRLTNNEIWSIVQNPTRLYDYGYAEKCGFVRRLTDDPEQREIISHYGLRLNRYKDGKVPLNTFEISQVVTMIQNRKRRFIEESGLSEQDFCDCYSQIWNIRTSNILLDAHADLSDNRHYVYFFDNVIQHYEGLVYNDLVDFALSLIDFNALPRLPVEPNEFPQNIIKTNNLAKWYDVYAKDKFIRDNIFERKIS